MPDGCWVLCTVRLTGCRLVTGTSAGTRNLRGGRTGLTGPAAAAKEEGGHAHAHGTRFRPGRPEPSGFVGGGCLAPDVATWQEFSEQAPELAARVFERFEAHRHKTMATIRADGSPRICGTEVPIKLGEVWLGGMTGNRRFADLRRDPRVAIHSASEDPDVWTGDAKIAGRAVEVTDGATKASVPRRGGGGAGGRLRAVPGRPHRGRRGAAQRRARSPARRGLASGRDAADDGATLGRASAQGRREVGGARRAGGARGVLGVREGAAAQREAAAADAGAEVVPQRLQRGDLLVEPRLPGPRQARQSARVGVRPSGRVASAARDLLQRQADVRAARTNASRRSVPRSNRRRPDGVRVLVMSPSSS